MSQFLINGGRTLRGSITIGGAKNSVLKMLPAALLCDGPVRIENAPDIEDARRMTELLEKTGAAVRYDDPHTITVNARDVSSPVLDEATAKRFRSSVMLVGPLLARFGSVSFPHPGGCVIGKRPIDLFLDGFRALGARVEERLSGKYPAYVMTGKRLRGTEYMFRTVTVTGTESLMMTAALVPGKTILRNCAMEPEIPALADFLNRCGARISGAGTHTIEITGVKKLRGGAVRVIPDRIDAASFAILAAATKSVVTIHRCIPEHISSVLGVLRMMGVECAVAGASVTIRPGRSLRACSIKTHEYPGFPTDVQAPFAVLATQAVGQTLVHETVYDGRLFYIESLNRMGARIIMCDPHRILIHGATRLYGRDMESPDLRAGLAFVIAALAAKGKTTIRDVYSIDRGYERIEKRLQALGADIQRTE